MGPLVSQLMEAYFDAVLIYTGELERTWCTYSKVLGSLPTEYLKWFYCYIQVLQRNRYVFYYDLAYCFLTSGCGLVTNWLTNNIPGYPSGAKAIALCTLFTFCFVLVLVDLPSLVGNSSLALRQSNDCSGTSGTTLKNSRECQLLKGTMDKKLYTLQTMIWNYLFMPKLQRCNHWILRMDKLLYPTFPWSVITYSFQDWN